MKIGATPRSVVQADSEGSANAASHSAGWTTDLWRAGLGVGNRRNSTPLVFLPGLGPAPTGRTQTQRLLQRVAVLGLSGTFDVWLVAHRSGLAAGSSISKLAADHARVIRSCFPGPVDLVGESTGGTIALRLALDHPDIVRRLVVVSAASRFSDAGREAQREVARQLRAGRPRRAAAAMLSATTTHAGRRRVLRGVGALLGRAVVGRYDDDLIRLIHAEDAFDVDGDLHRIAAPTLLIGGTRDGYYSADRFRQAADRIPGATLLLRTNRGHESVALSPPLRHAIRAHLARGHSS